MSTWKKLKDMNLISSSPVPAASTSGCSNLKRVGALLASNRQSMALDMDVENRIRKIPLDYSLPLDADVIDFWEKQKRHDSELAIVALTVLQMPSTQVSVERCFNGLGQILTKFRMKLGTIPLENIMFLRCNKHILEEIDFQTADEGQSSISTE